MQSNSNSPIDGIIHLEKPPNQSKGESFLSYFLAAMAITGAIFLLVPTPAPDVDPENGTTLTNSDEKMSAPAKVIVVTEFEVSADPGAIYSIFDVVKREDPMIEVFSYRRGTSGISYSRRLVNCANWTFMYLSEGDTVQELSILNPDKEMSKLTQGSSSTAVSYHGCKLAGLTD